MTTQNQIIFPLTDDIIYSNSTDTEGIKDLDTASVEHEFKNVHIIHVITCEKVKYKLPWAGTTMKHSPNDVRDANTWSRAESDTFQLRIGPNYDKFKTKANAAPDSEFYDVIGIE